MEVGAAWAWVVVMAQGTCFFNNMRGRMIPQRSKIDGGMTRPETVSCPCTQAVSMVDASTRAVALAASAGVGPAATRVASSSWLAVFSRSRVAAEPSWAGRATSSYAQAEERV
jgi:hypothetical protein